MSFVRAKDGVAANQRRGFRLSRADPAALHCIRHALPDAALRHARGLSCCRPGVKGAIAHDLC